MIYIVMMDSKINLGAIEIKMVTTRRKDAEKELHRLQRIEDNRHKFYNEKKANIWIKRKASAE